MEFQTNRAKQNVDRFEGSFQFHDGKLKRKRLDSIIVSFDFKVNRIL